MPTAPVDNRWALVDVVLAALAAHPDLDGKQIEPGWPGDQAKPECIWVNVIGEASTLDQPASVGPDLPIILDDSWTLPLEITVAIRKDLVATRARLGELTAAVIDVLRRITHTHDADSPGVRLAFALPSRRYDHLVRTSAGVIGGCRIEIAVLQRIDAGVTT